MQRLLRPRSIAVIGGGAWCANVVRECRRIGFAGPVWPVHPSRAEVGGLPAFARIEDLPAPPDAAFIGVNREAAIKAVAALAALGAGGAVCFASGFAEAAAELTDGTGLQQRLVAAAEKMPLLGPNCYGFINALDGAALWPDQHGAERVSRGVAIVTQSSNIAINLTMQRRGVPLAYVVTAGNQAQTGLAQIGAALLEDPRVTALGLHIEGLDPAWLEALAIRARALGKPVAALAVGVSDQARAGAVSHTASLAGSEAGTRALLSRLGIAQVDNLAVLLELLKLFHTAGPLASNRIVSLSCSGGEASLMADAGLAAGVAFPPLTPAQRAALRAALGPKVALSNPLDYHTYIWNDQQAMAAAFGAACDPSLAMACVVLDFPRVDRCTTAEWDTVLAALAEARGAVPLALISSLPENMPEATAKAAIALGITPFCGLPEALAAIAAAVPAPVEMPPLWHPGPLPPALCTLPEAEAKAALAAHGVPIPQGARADTPAKAALAATHIGFPVALKAEGVTHKTEVGAVALGLADADAVADAAVKMGAQSFLVEAMIPEAVAELLVGVTRDPAGWLLTLGAGGVLAELLRDTTTLLLPVTEAEILTALERLRIAGLLRGWRGAPPADLRAIARAVLAVQDYVAATPELAEAEINPLLCLTTGVFAADALIRKEAP